MDPVLKAILLSWDWRVDVILVLALAGTLYFVGWLRLRRRVRKRPFSPKRTRLTAGWRWAAYLGGLFFTALALMSPIDVLGGQLFLMHMIQHLLLIMIAPPLLLVANPMPFLLWGLPPRWRLAVGRGIGRLLRRDSSFRRGLQSATMPGIVWLFWLISTIGWHDPAAYTAALESEIVHDMEHLTFFLAGILFWWHVTGAGPRIHKLLPPVGRILFVIAAIPPNMLTGVAIAFSEEPIYAYYTAVPRLWGLSVIDDQRWGGLIMWIPGSMMYMIAALILAARLFGGEEKKPASPESTWATEDNLIAPGLEK